MKKICYIIICLIFAFSFIDVLCAAEKIYIKSIEIDGSSVNVIEKSKPSFAGYALNFDLEFREVGDNIKYKIVVHNETDKDYYVKIDTEFSSSNFLSYKHIGDPCIKSNSDTALYLVISYDNEVDSNLIIDNKYSESNKAILELVDDKGIVIKNPKTGNGNIIIIGLIVLLIISCVVLFIMNKKESCSTLFLFLFCIINFIPLFVVADSLLKFELNVNVLIQNGGYHVIYNPTFDKTFVDSSVLKDFNIINDNDGTCKSAYLEGNNYEPDYMWCEYGPLLKSKKKYMPGEVVQVSKIEMYKFSDDFNDYKSLCTINNDENRGVCPLFLEYIILDLYNKYSNWTYNEYQIIEAGYTYLENDFEVMNFSKLGNFNSIYPYSTFTMPEHDVYFYPDLPA